MSEQRTVGFLKGLLIGGLIGVVAGILFAPKSGKETREQIAKKSDELITKAKEEFEHSLEKGKKAYETMVGGISEFQEGTKDKVASWADAGKETLEDSKGRLKRAVEAGIDAYKEEKEKQKI